MYSYSFLQNSGEFSVRAPEEISYLYLPMASETGLKSSITPDLGGDAKIDQETFLLEPVSSENLHNNRAVRNFWCVINNENVYSVSGASASQEAQRFTEDMDDSVLTAGFMYQKLKRTPKHDPIESEVTHFVPHDENAEVMLVTIKNTSDTAVSLSNYAALPIYGRSADNIRDHRNVTSMLHRIDTNESGIFVCPTMSFDERGHRRNHKIYYVTGISKNGSLPVSFFPTVEDFIGEGGSYTRPRSVYEQREGVPAFSHAEGKEAMGAFRFGDVSLKEGESISYIMLLGVSEDASDIERVRLKFDTVEKVENALAETKAYWEKKVNVAFRTGSAKRDNLMKWVCFQPYLRRLFGCSFLPHHDYGRGGRGWRDLWQDCLSLLIMEPANVGRMIEMNYGGVRIDGTNATIIGDGDGNFIADRNGIARVWMDHALWPLKTTKFYIDQTGDLDILLKEAVYFKDPQTMRGTANDEEWSDAYGNHQRSKDGTVYEGTILEHILLEQLAAYYEVGDHGIFRLRGADWNDAIDMAAEKGESVAFTCAYVGNLYDLASLLRALSAKYPEKEAVLLEELLLLMNSPVSKTPDAASKLSVLNQYTEAVRHNVSGRMVAVSFEDLAANLEEKAEALIAHLRENEWLDLNDEEGWFNSYYDNSGRRVDGLHGDQIRMMLTGQVFAIMGRVATPEQIRKILAAADHYLYREEIGGYRLNTDFKELKFDMGRMFGFAYGEKENGAVFSHMTVMYANALLSRGFIPEGWKALKTLADHALDFSSSLIYPGIPEYFRSDGRGMYHYLTGAASWFMLTMVTEIFGVKGEMGNLVLEPKLTGDQFDEEGKAFISLTFGGRKFEVTYENELRKEPSEAKIIRAFADGKELDTIDGKKAVLPLDELQALSDEIHKITVVLK